MVTKKSITKRYRYFLCILISFIFFNYTLIDVLAIQVNGERQIESLDLASQEYNSNEVAKSQEQNNLKEQNKTQEDNSDPEENNSVEENSLTLLLDKESDIEMVLEELYSIDATYNITVIDEINLIHIESENLLYEDEILNTERISEAVVNHGDMTTIELEGTALNEVDSNEEFILSESMQTEINSDINNIELLSALSWHVNTVTDFGESTKISSGEGISIALIDSGIDYLHPFLYDKVDLQNAKSYVTDNEAYNDTNGHGTMVAGVIAQIAPDAVLVPYRVIGDSTGDSLWTIEAIIQATKDGNDIINMSLGSYKYSNVESDNLTIQAFERATEYARNHNVIIISSAGNKGIDLDLAYEEEYSRHLPGSIPGVLATSSTSLGKEFSLYSNYGSNVQFCAPGGDLILSNGVLDLSQWIYSTYPTYKDNGLELLGIPQGYMFSYGTSLSAPSVSAATANILSYYKKMTGEVANQNIIMNYLIKGSEDLGTEGKDRYFGNGQINIYHSLLMIEGSKLPIRKGNSYNTKSINKYEYDLDINKDALSTDITDIVIESNNSNSPSNIVNEMSIEDTNVAILDIPRTSDKLDVYSLFILIQVVLSFSYLVFYNKNFRERSVKQRTEWL